MGEVISNKTGLGRYKFTLSMRECICINEVVHIPVKVVDGIQDAHYWVSRLYTGKSVVS